MWRSDAATLPEAQLPKPATALLQSYHFDRPCREYCAKGRTAAELFWGEASLSAGEEASTVSTIPELDSLGQVTRLRDDPVLEVVLGCALRSIPTPRLPVVAERTWEFLQAPRRLLETLVRPSCPIPPEATAIHGIDDAALASAPSFEHIKEPLQSLLSGRLAVAYNADFDARLLEQSARARGVPLAWPEACEPRFAYAMRLLARWNGEWSEERRDWRRIRLGEAALLSGIRVPAQGHRTARDAQLVRELACHMAAVAKHDHWSLVRPEAKGRSQMESSHRVAVHRRADP